MTVAAQEFENLKDLEKFYADPKRVHQAALRVIHVQNATWATRFLLRKFNIDHRSEIVGMQGFSKWAQYEKPRQRNGKPFPNGRSWREQTDPWRNVSRTAFGLDYLKTYQTPPPDKRRRTSVFGDKPIDAQMMHLNAWEDTRSPNGYDVSVQRMSVYVQRNLGPPGRVSPEQEIKSPYARHNAANGRWYKGDDANKIDIDYLDNSNTVLIFETSASMKMEDCLIQSRADFENRWRRLSFYLRREDVTNDSRLAAQCTNMILADVFHGLAVVWQEFLNVAADHVTLLEDKIYENPADESRAPELWTNQAAWLKVDKVMYLHQDLVKEMQAHMRELGEVDTEEEDNAIDLEWLASTPSEYERLAHSVQEDLVQPTANLSDLMYKSVGIRDSRQSLQLGLSMWRLSWITFIFLPLTFIVSFFGMNVDLFGGDGNTYPSVGWYFLAAGILMIMVIILWYCVKHSLQRKRQTPYQRGIYEQLFVNLEDRYPLMWTSGGAVEDIEPVDFSSRLKWRLLKRWFSPGKTIDKKLYSSLDEEEFGNWARIKKYFLKRWLPTIRVGPRSDDAISMAEMEEQGLVSSAPASLRYHPGTISELAKMSTPVAMADAEPTAVQQISTLGLRPVSLEGRRPSSTGSEKGRRSSGERPSSRSSSGVMIEERNLSDTESDNDAGEGARRMSDEERAEPNRRTSEVVEPLSEVVRRFSGD